MNIKSKLTILVAIIFSLSFGLTKISYSDGHGGGMAVPKIEVTTVLEGMKNPWDISTLGFTVATIEGMMQ